jgi:hypothetical protein
MIFLTNRFVPPSASSVAHDIFFLVRIRSFQNELVSLPSHLDEASVEYLTEC